MDTNEINEGATGFLSCRFKDEKGNYVTPTLVVYRIDDITGSNRNKPVQVLSDTDIMPSSYQLTINIDPTLNIILDDTNLWEDRVMTVTFTYNGGNKGTQAFYFKVINLLVTT